MKLPTSFTLGTLLALTIIMFTAYQLILNPTLNAQETSATIMAGILALYCLGILHGIGIVMDTQSESRLLR